MEILELIKERRSIDPDDFNGNTVPASIIDAMLEAANWAPTHGHTEPWRFMVYAPDKIEVFGNLHATLYQQITPAEQFLQKKYEKLKYRGKNCSHIIICANKRGTKNNIPELEEIAATSCAIQNMLLVATQHHVGTFWSTGGMCYHPEFKKIIGFDDTDQILGIIYIGKYDIENPIGKRSSNWHEKVIWK